MLIFLLLSEHSYGPCSFPCRYEECWLHVIGYQRIATMVIQLLFQCVHKCQSCKHCCPASFAVLWLFSCFYGPSQHEFDTSIYCSNNNCCWRMKWYHSSSKIWRPNFINKYFFNWKTISKNLFPKVRLSHVPISSKRSNFVMHVLVMATEWPGKSAILHRHGLQFR